MNHLKIRAELLRERRRVPQHVAELLHERRFRGCVAEVAVAVAHDLLDLVGDLNGDTTKARET